MAKTQENGIKVQLTNSEIMEAAFVGVLRVVKVLQEGRKETYGSELSGAWTRHIEGALGEKAVAKHYNIYWHGVNLIWGTDVGQKTEVRATKYANGHLILHDEDDDDKNFWLVTGIMGKYEIRGWIRAGDGKNKRWWPGKNPERPAYYVPQSELHAPPLRVTDG